MSDEEKVVSSEAETTPSALPRESDEEDLGDSNGSRLIPDDVGISSHDGGAILPGVTPSDTPRHYLSR
jgi:hypothetical protein